MKRLVPSLKANSSKIAWASVLVMPGILLLLSEYIHRAGARGLLRFAVQSPGYMLEALLFLAAVYLLLLTLTNSLFFALWSLTLPLIFCVSVSYNKMLIREIPLMPWNTVLLRELASVLSEVPGLLIVFVLSVIPAAAVMVVTFRLFGGVRPSIKLMTRASLVVLSLGVLLFMAHSFAATKYTEGTLKRYEKYGFVRTFISYALSGYMDEPAGYSKAAVDEILKRYEAGPLIKASAGPLPDIILVQGEAFWDPTLLHNLKTKSDPVPTLHRLQRETTSGTLIVNSFGGNTTSTEFEVLTGISMSLVKPDLAGYTDIYSYTTGTRDRVTPLPAHLAMLGYRVEAIHPYNSALLGYDAAFRAMGFQKFASKADFVDAPRKGRQIADAAIFDKIVQMYESHISSDPNVPYFVFAVTIQNHYDYSMKYYPGEEVVVEASASSGMLDGSDLDILNAYLTGVRDTDALLGRLVDYLASRKRPVVLVFYGDHLPSLGRGTEMYEKAGLVQAGTDNGFSHADRIRLHTVPFIIWDNFGGTNRWNVVRRPRSMSAAYLQSVVLANYSIPMTEFQRFQLEALAEVPDLGLAAWPDRDAVESDLLRKYRVLQYYLLGH